MKIEVGPDGLVTLTDQGTFTEFAVRALVSDATTLEQALSSIGPVSRAAGAPTHVFVPTSWLLEQAGERAHDPLWRERFDGMVAYAAGKGWTDADGRVRAHVEHDDPPAPATRRPTDA
jgi:hypothetical protein